MCGETFKPSPAVLAYLCATMAWDEGQGNPFDLGNLRAAADLRTLQYTFVKLDANGDVIAASAAGEVCLGILQNKPNTGETAVVRTVGLSKCVASAAIAAGVQIKTTNVGRAVTQTRLVQASGNDGNTQGIAMRAATANGNIITVELQRSGSWPTADV
jgi:hypothetical protein